MADMPSRKRAERPRPSEHIWNLEEEDRRRMALKLRESTSQELVALKMNLGVIKQSDARLGPKASKALAECLTLADECAHEIHAFSHWLYPPLLDEFGLFLALRSYVEGLRNRCGLLLQLTVDDYMQQERLPKELETALFRVAQEGLSNVRLHSGSKAAEIELQRAASSGEALLRIRDHGRGVPARVMRAIETGQIAASGFGIFGMTERVRQMGGTFKVETSKHGTALTAALPLPGKRKSA
jgi:two-component system NarL family sensor kinase